MPDAVLKVGGEDLYTWTDVQVSTSIEQMCPSFTFTYVHTEAIEPLPVAKGYPCEVALGGLKVITGFVNRITHDDAKDGGNVYQVQGRGTTQDFVDCSARHGTGRFRDASLKQIATTLAKVYGVKVKIGDGMDPSDLAKLEADLGGKFPKYKLRLGETVHNTLSKAVRERGALLMESVDGELIITRAGAQKIPTVLERGKNVERWTRMDDDSQQFSEYEILGQRWGSNKLNGDKARGARGVAGDDSAFRFRPLTMRADRSVSSADLELRAQYERNRRQGMSETIKVTVPGWTYQEELAEDLLQDVLWRPNRIIRAKNDLLGMDDDLLISDCVFRKSREGTTTELTLVPPETFQPFIAPKRKRRRRGRNDALERFIRNTLLLSLLAAIQAQQSKLPKVPKD